VSVPWGPSAEGSRKVNAAHWAYTPLRPAGLLGRIVLDQGRDLYVGQKGERWVVDKAKSEAEAAGDLAEQDLVAVGKSATGGLVFVGQAGGMFEAASPLAPFSRVLSAPEPVAHVDASGQRLLAVTARGQLLASQDGGASFARVPLDTPFVGDVALLDDGRGLLLSYPEKLFATTDAGLHWAPVDAPSVGATRLVRLPGLVAVGGLGGSILWRPDAPPRFSRSTPSADGFSLPVELTPGPDVNEVLGGRGVIQGDEVWVTGTPPHRGEPWRLGAAHLGQRLETQPLAETEACQRLAVARSARWLVVACSVAPRGSRTAQIRFLRYDGGKGAPELLTSSLEGPLGEARVALGRDGQLLVSGACRPGLARGACDPDVPLLLPRWESAPSLDMTAPAASTPPAPSAAPSAAPSGSAAPEISSPWIAAVSPSQTGRPLAMAFAPSGTGVYLLARRGKSSELSIFVSHDGGRRFEGRDLGLASAAGDERRAAQSIAMASLSVTDEGIVAAAMEGQAGALLAITDEDGRLLSLSSPPIFSPRMRLGIAGRRALAVDGTQAFESLDGGVSWQTLGDTLALRCEGGGDCLNSVACGTGGCVVGQNASRVGWGGQADGRRALDTDARTLSFGSLLSPPPPLVCRLSKDKWIPLPRGAVLPSAQVADRGKNLWSTSIEDEVRGSVSVVHALPGGKIEEVPLFPPIARSSKSALLVSGTQIEGTAAVRFVVPTTNGPGGDPGVKSLEVAWENLFEGKISHATIRDAGFVNHTFRGADRAELALPGFVSISNGGIYVRPGPRATDPVYFLDHRGKSERMSPARFPERDISGGELSLHSDMVRLGSRNVSIATQDGLAVFRGHAGSDEVDVMTLSPAPGQGFDIEHTAASFSYLGSAPMLVQFATNRAGQVRGGFFPFRADGPLLGPRSAVPTQAALAARYRGCSAQDRATTPRVVAPVEPGSRRGVLIEGPDGSRFAALVSNDLVLYGTADSPCGGALDAIPVEDNRGDEIDRVIVSLSDLERAWFFRAINERIEARSMTCRLSPGASLPAAVLRIVEGDETPRRGRVSP
jgi:hypothetical protein